MQILFLKRRSNICNSRDTQIINQQILNGKMDTPFLYYNILLIVLYLVFVFFWSSVRGIHKSVVVGQQEPGIPKTWSDIVHG